MSPQANSLQVEERRAARLADEAARILGDLPDLVELPVREQVAQVRLAAEGGRDPAGRRGDADPGLVVLADEEDWHGETDLDRIARGVDRREGGRVVRGCVSE